MKHTLRDPKTGRFIKAPFILPADNKVTYEVEPVHIEIKQPKKSFWEIILLKIF